jgi:hypothetical protein
MNKLVLPALCLALGGVPAWSQGAVPTELASALERAVPEGDDAHWRFLLTFMGAEGSVVAHFDGSRPVEERWTLIAPDEAGMSDAQREIWEDIVDEGDDEGEDGGLFFSAGDVAFQSGTLELSGGGGADLTYTFRPQFDPEDEEEAAFAEHLRGEVTVGGEPAGVRRFRLWAPESFKPHFAVRVHAFEMEQEYSELDGLPAPVLTRMTQTVSGSAAFQSFEERVELEFSEIEYLGDSAR